MRPTFTTNLVNTILYAPKRMNSPSIQHGIINENKAISLFKERCGITENIEECGLIVDSKKKF